MPAMPDHMVVGRGNCAGPVPGGYLLFNYGPRNLAASLNPGATEAGAVVILAFPVPCDMRLERIFWNFRQTSGTANTVQFYVNSTPVVSGATKLSSFTNPFDFDYIGTSWLAPSGETIQASGGTLSTAAGARDLTQGQYILMAVTTDANTDGTTGNNMDDLTVSFLGVAMSHFVKTSTEND